MVVSVANTTAQPRNWAALTCVPWAKNRVPLFAEPITVNVISMGLPEIGLLKTCVLRIWRGLPQFGEFLVGNTGSGIFLPPVICEKTSFSLLSLPVSNETEEVSTV